MFDARDARDVRDAVAEWAASFEPGEYSGDQALALLDVVSETKRLYGAVETLLAARVADTGSWRQGNTDRSAAHWLARRTGTSIADAKAKLEVASQLADLPATAEAFRSGRLSDQQAREIAAGAVADPDAEQRLLGTAADDSLGELRNESRRAQAVDDGEARQKAIHERRGLRTRVDSDGTFRLSYAGTALNGSQILAALKPFTDAVFRAAHKAGRVEPAQAYAADGLLAMAQAAAGASSGASSKRSGSNVKIIVAVDATALRRGAVEHGEVCEIPGVGPVPVGEVRDLLGDAALAIVIKDGVAIQNVTHLKRRTTAHQRTALEFWGIRCQVKGCDSVDFVDIHHIFEWARTHHTRLDELRVACKFHHREEHKGHKPTQTQIRSRTRSEARNTPRADRGPVDRGPIDQELPLSA